MSIIILMYITTHHEINLGANCQTYISSASLLLRNNSSIHAGLIVSPDLFLPKILNWNRISDQT